MLHNAHPYVQSFIFDLEPMERLEHKVVINFVKQLDGENARCFNAPVANEVGIIMVNEQHGNQEVMLKQ